MAETKRRIDERVFSALEITMLEQSSSPSTPSSGEGVIYSKDDSHIYYKNDEGTETQLDGGAGGTSTWTSILSDITTTPASTSTITTTADLTGSIKVGYPLSYAIGGTTYYGIVTAITSSLITIAGASLGGTITAISYGDPARTKQETFVINGYYADASNTDILKDDLFMASSFPWMLAGAYVVQAAYIAAAVDTGATKEKVQITIGGSDLLSADATVSTALQKSVVNINTANYLIERGELIEIDVTKGTNGNGHDLTVVLVAVFA